MFQRYIITLLTLFLLTACSSDNNDDKENIIDTTTREVAEKAAANIRDPQDKAREAAGLAREHVRQIDEQSEGK